MEDIWFDIYIGDITCDDDGTRHLKPKHCGSARLTRTVEITSKNLNEVMDELRFQFNQCLKNIKREMEIVEKQKTNGGDNEDSTYNKSC